MLLWLNIYILGNIYWVEIVPSQAANGAAWAVIYREVHLIQCQSALKMQFALNAIDKCFLKGQESIICLYKMRPG